MTHRQCKSADYSLNVLSTVGGKQPVSGLYCLWFHLFIPLVPFF